MMVGLKWGLGFLRALFSGYEQCQHQQIQPQSSILQKIAELYVVLSWEGDLSIYY